MKEDTIVIIGAPRSGKTTYLALALGYFFRKAQEPGTQFQIWRSGEDASRETDYLGEYIKKMSEGEWPEKTYIKFDGVYTVRHLSLLTSDCPAWLKKMLPTQERKIRLVDLPGELCQKQNQQEDDEEFQNILKKTEPAQSFMLVIDAVKLIDSTTEHSGQGLTKDDMEGIAKLLGNRLKNGENFNLSIVFTKCDMIDNKLDLRNLLVERFAHYFSEVLAKVKHKYFCVTCLPNSDHRKTFPEKGRMPNSQWKWTDMEKQVEPFIWLFEQMPFSM